MIYSKVSGQGLPVLFLHGYAEDHRLWNTLIPSLSAKYKIITPDLPGFGRSERIPGSFSIDDVAEHIFAGTSKKFGVEKFVVLGHSLGGYVALALAEKYPQHVKGLGLINSTALADSPEKKENRQKTAEFIQKHGASFFLNNFVPNLFYEPNRASLAEQIEYVITMGQGLDETLLADYMLAMKNRPNRDHLLANLAHVLFIAGAMDTGFSQADFRKQIKLLKSQANGHILPEVGHMSMYEAPQLIERILLNFLNSM